MRRFCTAAAVAALMVTGAGCGSDGSSQPDAVAAKSTAAADPTKDKLAQIQARGTLVEYFEDDYPPQSMRVKGAKRAAGTKCADNQLTAPEVEGFDNDLPKLIAQKLGVEACFVEPTWTEVTAGNWGDRWDIAYGSGSINEDRMQRLWMTRPYYAVPNGYFVAKSSPYHHASDLNGNKVGSCADCSHELYLKGQLVIPTVPIKLNVKDPKVVAYETEGPGLVAAAKGKIAAFLAADPVGKARIEEGESLRRLPETAFTYYPSGFVDKSSGLSDRRFYDRVNEIVQDFQKDGTLKQLSEKWFGTDYASGAQGFDLAGLKQEVK
jgi:polar amino acid transport system substrate-binding protein